MAELELKRRGVCCPEPSCDHPILCEGCEANCQDCYGEQLASKDKRIKELEAYVKESLPTFEHIQDLNKRALKENASLKAKIAKIRQINKDATEGCAGCDECPHCQIEKALKAKGGEMK